MHTSTVLIPQFHSYAKILTVIPLIPIFNSPHSHNYSRIPTPIPRIPTYSPHSHPDSPHSHHSLIPLPDSSFHILHIHYKCETKELRNIPQFEGKRVTLSQ